FFFSSRRRHTRFSRDWSSDVCSSDLQEVLVNRMCTLFYLRIYCHLDISVYHQMCKLFCLMMYYFLDKNTFRPKCKVSCLKKLNRSEERRVGKEGRYRESK